MDVAWRMTLPQRLGFELCRIEVGGHPRRAARFNCSRCDAVLDVPLKNGNVLAPDLAAKIAVRDYGWQANAENAKAARCPACQPGGRRQGNLAIQSPEEEPDMPAAEKVTPIKPPPAPPAVTPTPLTIEQRVQIRSYLDKHFDDATGVYLDGMSDQRIAETIDVPRIHVEQIREAAYGPIRTDPAVAKMQSDIASFKRALDAHLAEFTQLQERAKAMEAELPKLSAR
jgi:hypothetical protein